MVQNKHPLIGHRELKALIPRDLPNQGVTPISSPVPPPGTPDVFSFGDPLEYGRHSAPRISHSARNGKPAAQVRPAGSDSAAAIIPRVIRSPPFQDDEYLNGLNLGSIVPAVYERVDKASEVSLAIMRATYPMFVPKHRYHTRLAIHQRSYPYLQAEQRKDFNARFRALPAEIREVIWGLAIEYHGKRTPQLLVVLRADRQLYREAMRAFYINNTFVFDKDKIDSINAYQKGYMLPAVWKTIRNMEIKHEYLTGIRPSFYHRVIHDRDHEPSPCIPCSRCDFKALKLAASVRVLHLDFSDSPYCVVHSVISTCRLAVLDMLYLERLILSISNVCCDHTTVGPWCLVETLNTALRITGYLTKIGTNAFCHGPLTENNEYNENVTSETWFWQAQPKQTLVWVDHLTLRVVEPPRKG